MINESSNDQGTTFLELSHLQKTKHGIDSSRRTRFTWRAESALHLVVCDSFWKRQPCSPWNRVAASSGLHRESREDKDLWSNHIMTMAFQREIRNICFVSTLTGGLGRKPSQAPHVPRVSVWGFSPAGDNKPPKKVDVDIKLQVPAVHLPKGEEPGPSIKELFQISPKAGSKHGGLGGLDPGKGCSAGVLSPPRWSQLSPCLEEEQSPIVITHLCRFDAFNNGCY